MNERPSVVDQKTYDDTLFASRSVFFFSVVFTLSCELKYTQIYIVVQKLNVCMYRTARLRAYKRKYIRVCAYVCWVTIWAQRRKWIFTFIWIGIRRIVLFRCFRIFPVTFIPVQFIKNRTRHGRSWIKNHIHAMDFVYRAQLISAQIRKSHELIVYCLPK